MDSWARIAHRIEAMQNENRFGLSKTQLKQSGSVEFVVAGPVHARNLKRWLEANILDGGRITYVMGERWRDISSAGSNGRMTKSAGRTNMNSADKARKAAGVMKVRLCLVEETDETLWQLVNAFFHENGIPGRPREPPYIYDGKKNGNQKPSRFISLVVAKESMKKVRTEV